MDSVTISLKTADGLCFSLRFEILCWARLSSSQNFFGKIHSCIRRDRGILRSALSSPGSRLSVDFSLRHFVTDQVSVRRLCTASNDGDEPSEDAEKAPKKNIMSTACGNDFSNLTNEELIAEYNKFAFVEPPNTKGFGNRPLRNRPIRDPVTGFQDGGRLKVSLSGRQKVNSGLVPLAMRDEIYRLHKSDPDGKGSLQRMATKTGLRVKKIQGIIKLREHELEIEKKQGYPLDQTLDRLARIYFGEKKSWLGEFDEEEKRARTAALAGGKWFAAEDGQLPYLRKMSEATSLGGFYEPWKKKVLYAGEKVFKEDDKFVFLLIDKKKKRRDTLI